MAELPIVILPKIPTYGMDITWPVHEEPKISTRDPKLIIKLTTS